MGLGGISLIVSLAVAGIAVIAAMGVWHFARVKRKQAAERALARGAFTLLAEPEAIFEGLKARSGGRSRWRRGRGVLVLTERTVRYEEFLPSYRLEVPIKRIRAADTDTSFLGKPRGTKVLILHFTDDTGTEADLGIGVADPDRWAIQIRKRLPA